MGSGKRGFQGFRRLGRFGFADADGLGGLDAEGNLHAVNGVDGGVAGRGATQRRHMGIGDETHVHQVVLDGFGEVQRDQHRTLANF